MPPQPCLPELTSWIIQPNELSGLTMSIRLPSEVWRITLHYLRDRKSQDELTYLWTTVRHVCRQFKEEMEEIFRMEHLPKTWLHFNISKLVGFHIGLDVMHDCVVCFATEPFLYTTL